MAPGAKEKKASRITTACNPCRSRKQKCSGERPECEQCLEYNRVCAWPEQLKRGPAKGYIEALEHRLHETEGVLLKILPHVSQDQLSAILSEVSSVSTASPEDGVGRHLYVPISPQRKRGVEHWKSFPLNSVENIRKWEQDCRSSLRRSSRSSISIVSVSHSYDADPGTMMMDSSVPPSSSSSTKRLKRSVDETTAAFDGRPATLRRQSEEDLSSEEIQSSTTSTYGHRHHRYHPHDMSRSEQQDQDEDQDRDPHRLSPEESGPAGSGGGGSSFYAVDHHNALSHLAFLKGGGGNFVVGQQPSGPPQLSSWDAAPPIKFQQQFLW